MITGWNQCRLLLTWFFFLFNENRSGWKNYFLSKHGWEIYTYREPEAISPSPTSSYIKTDQRLSARLYFRERCLKFRSVTFILKLFQVKCIRLIDYERMESRSNGRGANRASEKHGFQIESKIKHHRLIPIYSTIGELDASMMSGCLIRKGIRLKSLFLTGDSALVYTTITMPVSKSGKIG